LRHAFTLLELLIVLLIVAVISSVVVPGIAYRKVGSTEVFENRLKGAVGRTFDLAHPAEVCADFKNNAVEVKGEVVELPKGYALRNMVMPGRLVSGQFSSRFCTSVKHPTVIGFVATAGGRYYTALMMIPSGEVLTAYLEESLAETFKDKVLKGRLSEWFSLHSY